MTARAVRGDAVEVLGDVDRGDAEFGGLGDEIRRVGGGFVGVVGGGAQHLLGEFADGLDDHLLVVVGRQVEVVGCRWPSAGSGVLPSLDTA